MEKLTILIVDDNPVNMKLIRVLLTGDDYQVRTAADAHEALRVLNECHPKLILMDIQLPGIDGLELTRRLKADPSTVISPSPSTRAIYRSRSESFSSRKRPRVLRSERSK